MDDGMGKRWRDTRMRHALPASRPSLLTLGCPDGWSSDTLFLSVAGFWPCSAWLDPSLNRTMAPGSGDPCTIFLPRALPSLHDAGWLFMFWPLWWV